MRKTIIGVLASHDSKETNNSLVAVFDRLVEKDPKLLDNFHFLFTGGTYERIINGTADAEDKGISKVKTKTKKFIEKRSTCLPSRLHGGVTLLAYCVVQRQCSLLWLFLSPITSHWLNPENLALMRLSDQWHAKRLMNTGSVEEWFSEEAKTDVYRNQQEIPLQLILPGTEGRLVNKRLGEKCFNINWSKFSIPKDFSEMTIALIAHDEMKNRMVDFAIDYEQELLKFKRILCTGTTGREVEDNARRLKENDKIYRYKSGPKGGDIEIASEILSGRCHVVIFFVDPLHPHPHIEDIRVVFGACMIQNNVRMLTNEMQAREWMDRVVKRKLNRTANP